MAVTGVKEARAKLRAIRNSVGGRALAVAALKAMQPAREQAREGAPVGGGLYGPYAGHSKPFDPYPKRTYQGRLVAPGFASRNIKMVSKLMADGSAVRVALGVSNEAFYALQFIEMGTSTFAKRPWLEPAFRTSIPEVLRVFNSELKDLLEAAAAKGS